MAKIKLNNNEYPIPDSALAAPTADFVAHLGTIAGSGLKVVIGGVEYGIDSSKVAGAVSALDTAFAELENGGEERLEGDGAEYYTLAPTALSFRSTAPLNELQEVQINGVTVDPSNYTLEEGSTIVTFPIDYLKTLNVGNYEVDVVSESKTVKGGFTVAAPELNEYGFYYNQPYMAYVEPFGGNTVFFLREGGVMDTLIIEQAHTERCSYTFENDTLIISAATGTFTGSITENGIFCNELYTTFELNNNLIAADENYIYKFNEDTTSYYSVLSVIDHAKSSYTRIKTGINGFPTLSIESKAFYYCENLGSITIPGSIQLVRVDAFWGCSSLDEVIYENCQVIDYGAYPDSPLSKGVTKNHSYFKNGLVCDVCGHCEHLHTELVGKTEEYSGDIICKDCNKTAIKGGYYIPAGATYYEKSTGQTFAAGDIAPSYTGVGDQYTYYGYEYEYTLTVATGDGGGWKSLFSTIPSADLWLTAICDRPVNFNVSGSVAIPDGIKSIGNYAFDDCTFLKSVTIPDSVTNIGSYAFSSCTTLTSITIGNSVTSIGQSAFNGCYSLTSITIPDSVTSIGKSAFRDCSSLTSITIPNGVTSIDTRTFDGCSSLNSITFQGTIAEWNSITKKANWNLNVPATHVQCSDGQVAL